MREPHPRACDKIRAQRAADCDMPAPDTCDNGGRHLTDSMAAAVAVVTLLLPAWPLAQPPGGEDRG